jgi:IclR family acetate operon transcriptional repressor
MAAAADVALRGLSSRTGESANLAILDGTEAVYVAHFSAQRVMRMFTEAGNRAPLHATGTGKVLLAYEPEDRRTALLEAVSLTPFTSRTIASREILEGELSRIRRHGFARDQGELEEGVWCLAVPILTADDTCLAALSVSGPRERLGRAREEELLNELRSTSAELARRLK